MNFALIFDTLRHLKPTQVFYQVYYRLKHNRFSEKNITFSNPSLLYIHWIKKNQCCFNHSEFCFLNQRQDFHGWNMSKYGNLWAYNLNYMDWLNQENSNYEFGAFWIDNFICEIKQNKIGLDPYPTALRCINWVKFIVSNLDSIPADKLHLWNSYLYSQCKLLYNRLEYHLLGNHLLEDAFSLYISSLYFKDYAFYKKSTKILKAELKEQILGDGAHFEQSPMYHCIILDRLLDCYNFTISNPIFENQAQITNLLQYCSIKMLGHLEAIIYSDGSIPLLNDSAYNIAPTSSELFNYAENLELIWNTIPLNECGYRRFNHQQFEGIIDIGHITASYQPGHSHADSFNYELRINGQPFIIDTGISTYEKNQRRQYERSTAAHNTVSINRQNSSQVWSGFRVGKRSSVNILIDSKNHYKAYHDGFGKNLLHCREFIVGNNFTIIDEVTHNSNSISHIHFAPQIRNISVHGNIIITDIATIEVKGANKIEISEESATSEYNILYEIKVVKLYFSKKLEYTICVINEDSISN